MLSLADAIIEQDINSVSQLIRYGVDINELDEYGFTPLIEAAIVDNLQISKLLLEHGANPNGQDVTGGTALHWATENNSLELCKLLLSHHADPNAYNFSGKPVMVMPTLRQQSEMKRLLIDAGADQVFTQDYINTKLLGHVYELVGPADIVDPKNNYVQVDFEGFFLEVTLGLIAETLVQFQNHFASRKLRRFSGIAQIMIDSLHRAAQLLQYQQYRVDVRKHRLNIESLLEKDPIVIPVGYEGHAITFIKCNDIWVKCDRREDSRLYDNIMFYRIGNPENLTKEFMMALMYVKQDSEFINTQLDKVLGLMPMTELKIEAQVSGNCSWANVEATIPAIFFLILMQFNRDPQSMSHYKTLALNFFHSWREWNKDRALQFCIQGYQDGDVIRRACKAEILAAILFQRCDIDGRSDRQRIESILSLLIDSPYNYILKNYLRVYYYKNQTPEGKRFADFLKEYDFPK
jgi:hypothetical protein